MQTLIHGGDIYGLSGKISDFSSNISPLGLPGSVRAALAASMDTWHVYPDPLCRDLIAGITSYEGILRDVKVLCGAGAVDLIFRIVSAVKPKRALLVAPSFSEYEHALAINGCEIFLHRLLESEGLLVTNALLEDITPDIDIVFLCNPNNPTGLLIRQPVLQRILARCAECGTTVVVDECFLPFVAAPAGESVKPYLSQYPNVILLKAFTKLYAMAGLRLGYLLCSDEALVSRMQEQSPPWTVSVPALIAGCAAIADEDYVWRARDYVMQERRYLQRELQTLPIKLYSSQANFFFFYCSAPDLKVKLLERGFLIRDCSNYHALGVGHYRIAVKTHQENEALIAAMRSLLTGHGG